MRCDSLECNKRWMQKINPAKCYGNTSGSISYVRYNIWNKLVFCLLFAMGRYYYRFMRSRPFFYIYFRTSSYKLRAYIIQQALLIIIHSFKISTTSKCIVADKMYFHPKLASQSLCAQTVCLKANSICLLLSHFRIIYCYYHCYIMDLKIMSLWSSKPHLFSYTSRIRKRKFNILIM